jgi:hypothetical protein
MTPLQGAGHRSRSIFSWGMKTPDLNQQEELAEIYVKRGIDRTTAEQVARQLMAKDPLTAHARDELGISEITTARPVQAALTSAVMFSVGAAMPLLMVVGRKFKRLQQNRRSSAPACRVEPHSTVNYGRESCRCS